MTEIHYAWSVDGQNWTEDSSSVVLSATLAWEGNSVGGCEVMKDGSTYKIWYATGSPTGFRYNHNKIGYATSPDGINWTKHANPVLETGAAGTWESDLLQICDVIKEDNLYKMWYLGGKGDNLINGQSDIGFATSPDGISWTKQGRVLSRGASEQWDSRMVWGATVVPVSIELQDTTDDRYEMIYSGASQSGLGNDLLGYATSEDNTTWIKSGNNPDNTSLRGLFGSSGGLQDAELLKFNGQYHLWYSNSTNDIFYATGTR